MPTLNWIGKEAVIRHHKEVPFRLLETDEKLSHRDEDGGNLIVQGDNLHALKALLPRYAGKVKCIYIDPPYNTGKEGWVYNDNVNSPEIRQWLEKTVGKEGEDLSRHDKWLCMMYPRLVLLKEFLSEDGAIFVSIDDNELQSLIFLLTELFSTKNYLATFAWKTDGNFDNQAKIKVNHEYIVAFARNSDRFEHPPVVDPSIPDSSKLKRPEIRNTIVKNGPKNPISNIRLPAGFPAGFAEGELSEAEGDWPKFSGRAQIEEGTLSTEVVLSSGWSSKRLLEKFIENKFNPIRDSKNQETRFELMQSGTIEIVKVRDKPSHVVSTLGGFSSTQNMSARLKAMGISFDYPKPVELIQYLISMMGEECLVLDSFAGSGTTGQAVLKQNAEDGGNRKFILVEMDEGISRDITAERVRRAAKGYTTPKGKSVEGLGGGFSYCRLSEEPLFDEFGAIREDVTFAQLAEFVWFAETGTGYTGKGDSPLLGVHGGRAVYLLFNGILGDRRPNGGNILTKPILDELPAHDGNRIIYAAASRLGEATLQRERITFKQTPYAIEV
ncbi:MAG: site-specific DNA-methyltransferase [Verrucomicrobiales bacterium]|nr:site-specific DNA-methyltransferase [Verrucomicrobiales bacterium]